jgi:predicted ATP-grasp superfamily ATP-dependent carboligase
LKTRAKILLATLRSDWTAPCGLPSLLRRANVEIHLLAPEGPVHASSFVHSLPARPDGAPAFVRSLREHLARHSGEYQLVLPGDDYAFAALAQEKDRDWLIPWFPVDPRGEYLEALCFKHRFNELCHRHGLRAPGNIACRDLAGARAAAEKFGYPVMLKNHLGAGGHGVRQAADPAELERHYAALTAVSPDGISVQEHIAGETGNCHVVAWHGKVLQWYCYKTIKTWPRAEGPPALTTTFHSPEADELSFRVAAITGYHGLFGLDWIQSDRDGRIYLLECNPRMTPAIFRAWLFGLDLNDVIADLWSESPPDVGPRTIRRSGQAHDFPQDILRCIDEGDWRGLWANARDTLLRRNYIAWSEPRLVYRSFRLIAVHFLKTRTRLAPALKALRRRLRPAQTCF